MENDKGDPAENSSQETPTRSKANAVIDALDEFLIAPSPSTRIAAMDAMQAYFAEADKFTAPHGYRMNR